MTIHEKLKQILLNTLRDTIIGEDYDLDEGEIIIAPSPNGIQVVLYERDEDGEATDKELARMAISVLPVLDPAFEEDDDKDEDLDHKASLGPRR